MYINYIYIYVHIYQLTYVVPSARHFGSCPGAREHSGREVCRAAGYSVLVGILQGQLLEPCAQKVGSWNRDPPPTLNLDMWEHRPGSRFQCCGCYRFLIPRCPASVALILFPGSQLDKTGHPGPKCRIELAAGQSSPQLGVEKGGCVLLSLASLHSPCQQQRSWHCPVHNVITFCNQTGRTCLDFNAQF